MTDAGDISPSDPRSIHGKRGASLQVPLTSEQYREIWQQVLNAGSPPELKPTLLVARKVVGEGSDDPVSARDLAVCLESASVRLSPNSKPKPGEMGAADLVERAALICDSAVLQARHSTEKSLAAPVIEATGIPPQRVLSGMMRMSLIDEKDIRVQAFVEGHLSEFNSMDRTQFFAASSEQLKGAMREFPSLTVASDSKKDVARSVLRLNAASESKSSPVVKEADVLHATAELAESFSKIYASRDPERAKNLAGISMSASSRGQLIKQQYPEKFVMSGLSARSVDQQE